MTSQTNIDKPWLISDQKKYYQGILIKPSIFQCTHGITIQHSQIRVQHENVLWSRKTLFYVRACATMKKTYMHTVHLYNKFMYILQYFSGIPKEKVTGLVL